MLILTNNGNRANSTSVVTVKSSDFRMARRSPSSYSEKTQEELLGRLYIEGSTRKAYLRLVVATRIFSPTVNIRDSEEQDGMG